ncbi:MAG: ATP synthase F1 subunit delta [Bacteroidetes bacterium]|nr:ATP synthase F1 subunit delta [Bacteroidota bacterium]
MRNPRLAARYAKSLMGISLEKNQLEQEYADMQWLHAVCASSHDFVNLLRSPIIKADKKQKIVAAVTDCNISPLTTAFLNLMISKGREEVLPEITTAFIDQYKAHKNIHVVKLTSAAPLTDEVKNKIVEQVKKAGNMPNIELQTSVDESLIGGFVLQTGDKLIDASIAYDLKHIARQFDNNDFIYKVR